VGVRGFVVSRTGTAWDRTDDVRGGREAGREEGRILGTDESGFNNKSEYSQLQKYV
jgi:hypothetical protein